MNKKRLEICIMNITKSSIVLIAIIGVPTDEYNFYTI